MKKIIVFVAFICAFGAMSAFADRPSVDVPRQAAVETLSPLAMMQASRWLPTEGYDTF